MPANSSSARRPFVDYLAVDTTLLPASSPFVLPPPPPGIELCLDLLRHTSTVFAKNAAGALVPTAPPELSAKPPPLQACGVEILDSSGRDLSRYAELRDGGIACFSDECEVMREKLHSLPCMLKWAKDSAAGYRLHSDDGAAAEHRMRMQVLTARRFLFLEHDHPSFNSMEYPYQKRRRTSHAYDSSQEPNSDERADKRKRKSKRLLGILNVDSVPRKHIPVGSTFQAEVPELSSKSKTSRKLDDEKWFSNKSWPIERHNRGLKLRTIGKGRPESCKCFSPGSMGCTRLHIKSSKRRLESELGQAFSSWRFIEMGEGVSASWFLDEEIRFEDIVKQNPVLENKCFLEASLLAFPAKTKKDIIGYYYNVFLPRRIRHETSSGNNTIDSDDDFYVNPGDKVDKIESKTFRISHWLGSTS